MSKGKSAGVPDDGELTVMFVKIKGGNSTLQAGLNTLAAAVAGINAAPAPRPARIPAQPSTAQSLPFPIDPEVNIDLDSGATDERVVDVAPTPTRAPRQSRKAVILNDIDLTSGEMSLQEYLTKYETEVHTNRYLLIAFWLKKYRGIEEVSIDHINTGYRVKGWVIPPEAVQPLRDMASKRQWLDKGSKGHYKLNQIGETEVTRIMAEKE